MEDFRPERKTTCGRRHSGLTSTCPCRISRFQKWGLSLPYSQRSGQTSCAPPLPPRTTRFQDCRLSEKPAYQAPLSWLLAVQRGPLKLKTGQLDCHSNITAEIWTWDSVTHFLGGWANEGTRLFIYTTKMATKPRSGKHK